MSWIDNYLVARSEIITQGFSIVPGQTLDNDNRIVSNAEARQKICCSIWDLPGGYPTNTDPNRVPIKQQFIKTYAHSLRYSATSCSAACSGSYTTYWSECATLAVDNCGLYTDCQLITQAADGYYLNSSGSCYELNNSN